MIEFRHDGHMWTSEIDLPFWSGYRNKVAGVGPDNGKSGLGTGRVEIIFAPEGRDDTPLTDNELALVQEFLDRERQISLAVRSAVFANYKTWQFEYGYDGEEKELYMPDIQRPDDLRDLIGLKCVYIHQISNGHTPYAGYEFDCSWDDEHGLGVLTNGTRIVELGYGDTAILLWIARRDLEA